MAAVADAYLIHRFLHTEVSSLQQYACMLHPSAGQVLAQRLPGVVFEEMAQTGGREVYQVGQSFGVQVPIKFALNQRRENLNSYIHGLDQQSALGRTYKTSLGGVC